MILWCHLKKGALLIKHRAQRNNSKKAGNTSREDWRGCCKKGITGDHRREGTHPQRYEYSQGTRTRISEEAE
jgi:hypothetical protein